MLLSQWPGAAQRVMCYACKHVCANEGLKGKGASIWAIGGCHSAALSSAKQLHIVLCIMHASMRVADEGLRGKGISIRTLGWSHNAALSIYPGTE